MKDLSQISITQNAHPSKCVSVDSEGVGVVSHNQSESLLLIGQFKALGDGVVKGDCLVQRHGRSAGVVSLVNAPTWREKRERWLVIGCHESQRGNALLKSLSNLSTLGPLTVFDCWSDMLECVAFKYNS